MSGIFECGFCGTITTRNYVSEEGRAGRLGSIPTAVVAETQRGRLYFEAATSPVPGSLPLVDTTGLEAELSPNPRDVWCRNFGLTRPVDLFTPRQLVTLATLSGLVAGARLCAHTDAVAAGFPDDSTPLQDGGGGAQAYADAVATYLAFGIDKMTDTNSALCSWQVDPPRLRATFGRQALPMVWDFAEANPFGDAAGDYQRSIGSLCEVLDRLAPGTVGRSKQLDAVQAVNGVPSPLVSTDPPYYDNVGYADLSDYFYVWLRRSLSDTYPSLFQTMLTPKEQELVATPYRFGGDKKMAEAFFQTGLAQTFLNARRTHNPGFPLTVYYAFKQTEGTHSTGPAGMPLFEGRPANEPVTVAVSTGWETMLESLVGSGFAITGTWPVRSEMASRNVAAGANALASSIVIVCRPRPEGAPSATRTDFLQELSRAMREALPLLTSGDVAPVDLAQASIGPGMAVYSKYSSVVRQDGKPVTVREALQDINNAISAYRSERTSSFDEKTRFCIDFYDQFGFAPAAYGDADNLARSKNVGVNTLESEHLLVAEAGKAWLVPLKGYPAGVAGLERRFGGSAWEACMRLSATLQEEGESATAALARELGEGVCARARELAVWLYTIADARKRSEDALAFNALDASWPEIQRLIASAARAGEQGTLGMGR